MAKLMSGGSKAISLDDLNDNSMSAEELNAQAPQTEETVVEPPVSEPQEPEVEPQVETPTEPAAETPQETPDEPQVETPAEPEQPEVFNFALFNSSLNTNYESLDQIKADLDKPTMEAEYQEAQTQLESLQAQIKDLNETNELLLEQTDPSNYFTSDDAMKLEVFRKQNPKRDAAIAQKVFATEDLNTIDDLEMVKMGRRFRSSRLPGTDADLEAAIMEDLNIESDTPYNEWPATARIRLADMASGFREGFEKIKEGVSLPDRLNIEEMKAQRKQAEEQRLTTLNEGWNEIANEAASSTNKISVPIGTPKEGEEQVFFEWDLAKPPQEDIDKLKQELIDFGINPDKDGKALFESSLENVLVMNNIANILQKYGDDRVAREKEKFLEETNNPNPLKDSQRTDLSSGEKLLKERTEFATEGLRTSLHGHPLLRK